MVVMAGVDDAAQALHFLEVARAIADVHDRGIAKIFPDYRKQPLARATKP